MDQPENTIDDSSPQYTPADGEAQLTVRAVIAGCLTGSIVACSNIYIGLKIGWTFGASITAAVLSFAMFAAIGRRLSVLETNIAQTAGAAAGGMAMAAGLVAAIPAMEMSGHKFDWPTLFLWALSVSFLGVFFAVPLRRQFIEVDKLRFPTGTATAATILAMNSDSSEAVAKARVLVWTTVLAGAFVLLCYFVPQLEEPPLDKWLGGAALATMSAWGFSLYFGPSLMGAGFLMGPRVVLSLMLGTILGWAVLGPLAQYWGWANENIKSYDGGPRGWILWPGVALMVSEALTSLALSWRVFIRAFTFSSSTDATSLRRREEIPNSWWMGGLVAGALVTIGISSSVFAIPWYHTLIAIALSAVLAIVATRSTGETDITPVSGMAKVTQLLFGGLAPGKIAPNLMLAGVTGAGATQAADLMSDLKTGYLLGASPRKQFGTQLIGICAGLVFVIPVYKLFTAAHEFGSKELPAPSAYAWKAMADVVTKGFGTLPPHATEAVGVAVAVGVLLPLMRRVRSVEAYVPSGLAAGIAMLVYPYQSLAMFYGLVIWFVWKRIWPATAEKYTFVVASGLIAGEGLMGLIKAGLTLAGVKPLT